MAGGWQPVICKGKDKQREAVHTCLCKKEYTTVTYKNIKSSTADPRRATINC
jgi:hypothetical protein